MFDRANALRQAISEYEFERDVESTRLNKSIVKLQSLQFAYENVSEHGDADGARLLENEILKLERDVAAQRGLLQQYEGLLGYFHASLDRLASG